MIEFDMNTGNQREPCGNECKKSGKCPYYSEICIEKGMYCKRHCPCKKGKLKTTIKKRKKKKDNCGSCNVNIPRCTVCLRCIGNHCRCALKTPPPKRSTYAIAKAKIEDALAKTPFQVKFDTGELEIDTEAKLFEALNLDRSRYHNL